MLVVSTVFSHEPQINRRLHRIISEMFYMQFDKLFIWMLYEVSGYSKSKARDSLRKVGEVASVAV
jgi:hypothetical protein